MAREKRIFFEVPSLYKRQCLDHILFGYVHGIRRAMPSVTVQKCIIMFLEDNEIHEEDWPVETAEQTYYRMKNEYKLT